MSKMLKGRCLCGGVSFTIRGAVAQPVACHCRSCQRQSGGYWVAVTASKEAVTIERDRLAWVTVSPRARRGFCRDCGSYLFWEPFEGDSIDIAFGALDETPGLTLSAHIHTAEGRLPIPEDGLPRYPHDVPEEEV